MVPPKMNGMRRPNRVCVRSDNAPATGCQMTAINEPAPSSTPSASPSCCLPTNWSTRSGRIRPPRLVHR